MDVTFQKFLTKYFYIFCLPLSFNSLVTSGFTLVSCRISFDIALCSKNNLKNVPTDIPSTVKGIDLGYNNISKLQVTNFTNFPNVTELNLRHNSISQMGQGTFSQLLSLKRLILKTNQLYKLNDGVFDGLTNLEELILSFNKIETVGQNEFQSLKNLKGLDISRNKLRTIVKVHLIIQHMPHLQQLYIKSNGIHTFQSWEFTNISTELKLLDLSDNPLMKFKITSHIFSNLTQLRVGNPSMKLNLTWDVPDMAMLSKVAMLDVSSVRMRSNEEMRNLLATFNTSLTTLRINAMKCRPTVLINNSCSIPTVKMLQLQRNQLFFISSKLFTKCVNITEIDLNKNDIKKIADDSFNFLPQLRILRLSRNELPIVPLATRNLPKLSELDLSFNLIKMLGCHDFANMTSLKQLSLQYNSLATLNNCIFQDLLKLQVLELQGNHIANLNNAFQTSLPSLKVLHLNNNSLTVVKNGELSGLQSLTNLSLFQNGIATLEEDCFVGLTNLSHLQLQINKIVKETLERNSFRHLVNLKSLDIGLNHIKYSTSTPLKVPPFLKLTKLENLAFPAQHYRGKSELPSNFLQGLTNLLTLNCKNIQMINSSISDDFFIHTPKLDSLDVSANDLTDFSANLFMPIRNLTKLRVTSTNLRSLDFLIDAKLEKLEFLQARKNAFSVITEDVIKSKSMKSLRYLDLKFNSFTCDCDNSIFIEWVKNSSETQVNDAHSFTCNYPPHRRNAKLLDLNVQSCVVDIGFILFVATTCVTIFFMIVSFTYNFLRYQLVYAYYLFLAWLFDTKNKNRQAPSQYDAFVSYNVHDEAWVYGELVPHLEEQQGWKLCLHHRDFEPGKPIVENITDAIYSSRKTLCVISRRYLQSEWCSREMQVASFRLFDERKDVLIFVFLEDIPSAHLSPYYRMRRLLKRQTYLSWPRAHHKTHLFWEKLRQALGRNDTAAEDRLRLTVTETQ